MDLQPAHPDIRAIYAGLQVLTSISARIPSSSGRQGEGIPFYDSQGDVQWTMGSGAVSQSLEEGISSMAKAEVAFISCPVESIDPATSILPPNPEGVDRIEYEVELHSMIQAGLFTSLVPHLQSVPPFKPISCLAMSLRQKVLQVLKRVFLCIIRY